VHDHLPQFEQPLPRLARGSIASSKRFQHDLVRFPEQTGILQQALSPLVHRMQKPSLVISHLHMPMVRLQQHTTMLIHHAAATAQYSE
jgi:hypothetical protein